MTTSLAFIDHAEIGLKDLQDFCGALYLFFQRDLSLAWGLYAVPWVAKEPDINHTDWRIYLEKAPLLPKDWSCRGRHDYDDRGQRIPTGYVFVDRLKALGEDWSTVAAHEAIEMLSDPYLNLWCLNGDEFWSREICDPVQGLTYEVQGHQMPNFVLPDFYVPDSKGPWDFMGKLTEPFSISSSGYASMRIKDAPVDVYGSEYPAWRKSRRLGSRNLARKEPT